jgi:glycosyltransferase involved in cell wall biosynthesis
VSGLISELGGPVLRSATAFFLTGAPKLTACSVVLATYEGERFIAEQLDSIVSQLTPNDEVIVSDDASSDGTLDLVRSRGDPRIHILANRERVGYVRNFQRAIDQVRGKYVFFSDQDDVWLPGKVAAMCAAMQKKPVIASDAIVVNERLEILHRSYFQLRGARAFSWKAIFLRPPIIGATMSCRYDYLQSLLPLPARVPHDFWLAFNAAWDDALQVVPTPLLLYRRHAAAYSPTATDRTRSIAKIATERCILACTMVSRRTRPRKRKKAA